MTIAHQQGEGSLRVLACSRVYLCVLVLYCLKLHQQLLPVLLGLPHAMAGFIQLLLQAM